MWRWQHVGSVGDAQKFPCLVPTLLSGCNLHAGYTFPLAVLISSHTPDMKLMIIVVFKLCVCVNLNVLVLDK